MEVPRINLHPSSAITKVIICSLLTLLTCQSEPIPQSGCRLHSYNDITCTGNFNFSDFLISTQTKLIAATWFPAFNGFNLEILNSDIGKIDENFFGDLQFGTILIENATKLGPIHPNAFDKSNHTLEEFRAINTNLDDVTNKIFDKFTNFRQFYSGPEPQCPSDPALIAPCTCKFGRLGSVAQSGLYGTKWTYQRVGNTAEMTCDNNTSTGEDIAKIFAKLSESSHTPKYFDSISINGENIVTLPSHLFQNYTVGKVISKSANLSSIHPSAFEVSGIPRLEIESANFTRANDLI